MKSRVTVGVIGEDIGLPLLDIAGPSRTLVAEDHPAHSHPSWELLVLLWGRMVQELPDGCRYMTGGSVLVVRPGVLHGPPRGQLRPGKFLWMRIFSRPKSLAGSPFLEKDYQEHVDSLDRHAGVVLTTGHKLMTQLEVYWRLLYRFSIHKSPPVTHLFLRTMTCLTIMRLVERINETAERDGTRVDKIVKAACEYMAAHSSEELSVGQIAKYIGYDASWFEKRFRAEVGVPPSHYLQSLRVDKAKELLRSKKMNITEVALEAGFASSQHFAHVFRKFAGLSPSEFRRSS